MLYFIRRCSIKYDQLVLAILLVLVTPFSLAQEVKIVGKSDLATLQENNLGISEVAALSADGKIVGGNADNDNGYRRAVIWSGNNYATKSDLGTLAANVLGNSAVVVLSADGKIAGGKADYDDGYDRAVIWSGDNYAIKTGLSTLKADNSGHSFVYALSADGKIAGGWADHDNGYRRAVIWLGNNYATKTDLGSLMTEDNTGNSEVAALSADGKIAGGWADHDNGYRRAVIWLGDNYVTKINLGSLAADNSGYSFVTALSADGKIVGGIADSQNGDRAVIWSGDNYTTKTDLGTLRTDNLGQSAVNALSADGKIAGGRANYDSGSANSDGGDVYEYRALIWSGDNYATKTDLGTLKADNSGHSEVTALSADGKIAAGTADNEQNQSRATLWKLNYLTSSTLPTIPVVVSNIDVENTVKTINQLGADSFSLMAMQSHALDRMQHSCSVRKGFCFGLQKDYLRSKDVNQNSIRDVATGLNVGYGFTNGLSVGVSLDHSLDRKLPYSYKHTSDNIGVGAVVRYQSKGGYFAELSGAYDDYSAEIKRPLLANTELGVNEAKIKGTSYGLKLGKAFGSQQQYRAYVGAKQRDISRDAYTENENTAFPISYGKMHYKDTAATFGANANVKLGEKFAWLSDISGEYRLNDNKPTYTASLTGIEQHHFVYDTEPEKWRGQIATGIRYYALPSTHLELMPYAGKNATGKDYHGAMFRLENTF